MIHLTNKNFEKEILHSDIPVIIISAFSKKQYKNLEKIDPNLVYIEKTYLTKEKLLKEVEGKLLE